MIKQIMPLSLIVGLRFFGLFIVLPVLSVYALELEGGTPFLAGVVVGGYALTQALFQVPFGVLSDKIGRKVTIFFGLVIFIIGSIIAATADTVWGLMLGRFLQGAGAIGSVVSAMVADLVKEEQRPHAMAILGGTIALSFAVAMIVAPLIGGYWGIDKLFWLTALLSLIAIVVLFGAVPQPPTIVHTYEEGTAKVSDVFKDKALVRMYVTFLFHSSIMTMAFYIIPMVMTQPVDAGGFGWEKKELWKVYFPAMVFGFFAMAPSAIFGEKYNKGKQVFMISVAFIAVAFMLLGFSASAWAFILGVVFFFIGFNMFEPLLQSFVAKFAKVHQKGTALGVANTFAYTGIFFGGLIAGWIVQYFGRDALSVFVLALSALWFWWVATMPSPNMRANVYLPLDIFDRERILALRNHKGIAEVYINETEKIGVVRYEKDQIDEDTIRGMVLS